MAGRGSSTPAPKKTSIDEISEESPLLQLIKSETIPPSPNPTTLDWLPDYSGLSWLAYGASSLLVISHFPSPLSQQQTLIGPIYRQIIELSRDRSSVVKALAWSPSLPCRGEIAVAIENCICICSDAHPGSFYWIQVAVLVQCDNMVEAIRWTGSGDGIISAGTEVVLWKRKTTSWEIAWKFTPHHPQSMVSATWSTGGPVAAATALDGDASRCVLMCQMDEKAGLVNFALRHPQPVSMIQWRPSTERNVLLTCCSDGTVRLWSEIDSGRSKNAKQSLHVIAVIEINQFLNGTLGRDIFVTWAAEISSIVHGGGVEWCSLSGGSAHDMPGRCEWLIGYGPGMSLTFWAVHCLDDISPLRFPRVTLWKTLDLAGVEGCCLESAGSLSSEGHSLFIKAAISRSRLHGPPTMCSLFQLLSDNSMGWSQLYTLESSNTRCESLSLDGHSGNILQVAIHPYAGEVELAASLDSNGLLLFWHLSTISNGIVGIPALVLPTWKLVGKMATKNLFSVEYTCLRWVPSLLNIYSVLLLGHSTGIDCFMVGIDGNGTKKLVYHKLCTIPFVAHNHLDGPTSIFAIPLPSTCRKTFISNHFMVLGTWIDEFQALSWNVTLHSSDLSGTSCECNFENRLGGADHDTWRHESSFGGKRYSLVAESCSSTLSNFHNQVTSLAVVSPGSLMPSIQQKWCSSNGLGSKSAPYQMATGYSDGSIRLWGSTCSKSSGSHLESAYLPWELVGLLNTHQGSVTAISLSCCGGKIATISNENCSDNICTLCIWKSIRIMKSGNFLLEDKIFLNGVVVTLNWSSMGNGQLLLGVCMQNELRLYAQRNCGSQDAVTSGKLLETHIWHCIAIGCTSQAATDFIWGPGASPVLVHERYFCLFSKWSFHMDKKHQSMFNLQCSRNNSPNCMGGTDEDALYAVFTDSNICNANGLPVGGKGEKYKPELPSKLNVKSDYPVNSPFSTTIQQQYDSGIQKCPRSILDVAGELRGLLPIYHPDALLLNLYSGNWRQAYNAVRYLVAYLTSDNASATKPNHNIPQIHLSRYFAEPSSSGLGDKGLLWGRYTALVTAAAQPRISEIDFGGYDVNPNDSRNTYNSGSGKSEISGFIDTIENSNDITAITSMERIQMLAIVDLLGEISDSSCASAYESLDVPGRRFWVGLKFQKLLFVRRFGGLAATNGFVVDSGMIGWAFQSDCQDNLLTSFLSSEPSWQEMRNLGAGFWFTNSTQLRARMEKLARSQYLKKKDPKDCALLYIALNRVQVLAGLFKVSRDEKDKPLVGFLSRNFQDEKNKAAALKNAYVLMGRHQLELAIAFFLLGGDTSSAVSVCAKTLGDEQLALVICRLIEGNGGPLELQLISKFLLPAAVERGDCWLASLFEWALGNYVQSFLRLLGFKMDSLIDMLTLQSNQSAFFDPQVGQYCLVIATKNIMKNFIGECPTLVLTRWAALMTSVALNRRGLPIEALQCLSSSLSTIEGKDEGSIAHLKLHRIPHGIFEESNGASNWLSGDVALHVENNDRLNLALHYISNFIMEHPSWPGNVLSTLKPLISNEDYKSCQYKLSLDEFQHKLNGGLAIFEQKYALNAVEMLNMILLYSCNSGLPFLGYHILHGYIAWKLPQDENHVFNNIFQYPPLPKLFLKATEEISCFFARYLMCCSIVHSLPNQSLSVQNVFGTNRSHKLHMWDFYMKRSIQLLESFRDTLKMYSPIFLTEDLMMKTFTAVDTLEYYIIFTSAWVQRNLKGLILTIHPILQTYQDGHTPSNLDVDKLKIYLCQNVELMICDSFSDEVRDISGFWSKHWQHEQIGELICSITDDEIWQILGACLWRHLSNFTRDLLKSGTLTINCSSGSPLGRTSSSIYVNGGSESDGICTMEAFTQVPGFFAKLLDSTLACIASCHAKQLASVLSIKLEKRLLVPTLVWLEKSDHSHSRTSYNFLKLDTNSLQLLSSEDVASLLGVLWEMSVDPMEIRKAFAQENISWSQPITRRFSKGWNDVAKGIENEYENIDTSKDDPECSFSSSASGDAGSSGDSRSQESSGFLRSRQKESNIIKENKYFQHPEDIYKRNGELLEAMCFNSINQQQAAVASNKKGILFFNWNDERLSRHQSEYIWSEVDWPQNGWAGSESMTIPTFVSQGIGLGSKKGTHLGLGGATIDLGSFAKPGMDLTGRRAIGISGYGGVGASSLSWGTQEDFEFIDPPATVDNISTRAFSSHPSRPFFLAGSSNTHIYLWEFGKEKATATYGVLPAADVPPPYALASIAALRFDHCGQRFVTAALDGTICTWQLEVGGRSNIRPTESALCFNRHTSDVTYVAASGSVIAAAGYSSDNVNVVIWDTLAPTTASQASLICHEGGARSVSVFDNNLGSGSISPLIVTGGKGGDVGLHDFRFIATGKVKRHRHSNNIEQNNKYSSTHETHSGMFNKFGEQNSKGMLWYIPKAHLGSITRIATIPDTSLFLTGSKDGDVKLWDAKKAELVFHWSKLHEKHTFLQPSSRGFGGIVRAAVTDIQVLSQGFLTCGGDGTVKMVRIKDFS